MSRGWWALPAAGLCASGCLFYDSRWGQATAEQKHSAARLQPAAMEAPAARHDLIRRHAKVRGCVTQAYAAETLDWSERFDQLVRNASSVLAPSIGLELGSAGAKLWKPEHGEAGLATAIGDLPGCEGPEADWVVAMVQSTANVVSDFHVLGRGQTYSPYLAMRASNDPAELEAFAKSFPDLDETARQKLYSDRKRHKTLALFLHEFAHTLGAVHRTAKDTLMAPAYDSAERGYDETTLALLRVGVEIRLEGAKRYADARKILESQPDGFVESERLEQIDFLRRWERSAPREGAPSGVANDAPAAGELTTPVAPVAFETMPKEDRQTFDEALRLEHTSTRDAWSVAAPLFEAHPAVREVQELRCRLARARKFFPAVVEAHCARLAALGP
jgi:hypothetical protein